MDESLSIVRSTTIEGSPGAARGQWSSKLGFVLAAAGSAVGLGNIWKFPYITGTNGGGLFVLVYLLCVGLVGIPILAAEVLVGRAGQRSAVGTFRGLSRPRSPWVALGGLSVLIPTLILSYYSVVAGWCLDYVVAAATGGIGGAGVEGLPGLFDGLYASAERNLLWHAVFMAITAAIVIGGVQGGVERASRFLMPALFVMLLALLVQSAMLPGFVEGARFVFAPDPSKLTAAGVLEALGHAFFTLSVGMGAMLTYGSYLSDGESIPGAAISIGVLDTLVALGACLVIFPLTFSFGMEPAAGPGLVFKILPVAFAQMPFGGLWATVFFVLLFFAALTSAISLLEVPTSYAIDEWGLSRRTATLGACALILALGIPSALSGGEGFFGAGLAAATGRNWFDWFDHAATNWMLPVSGLGLSTFVAWRLSEELRQPAFAAGTRFGKQARIYRVWLLLLRYLAPVGIVAVFLQGIGVI
ncbi:sodium-dependent transporter [Vulgatibacter incomptus]|uniref:Transporter n=1 Tax=Vulgatibacter incomptus TaxID=1391653 RepID=A0A0K1PH88_9BACT|nr:sodium-dependent transporter [Vulgatibacter incomptus]AKU92885.1 Sodium-dependent transporter [Vulgatibacter incomptus]